jgi:hypothetical protein
MASQYQSRLFSSSLSSSSSSSHSHSHSHSPFSSSSPPLSPREIKQEKGIREEDWIMGEDGGPTSFQPPLRKPCRPLREPLPKRGNNVSYPRITGWTNSRSPLSSTSINRDIHQYSDDCFCFWCEDERDAIPDTLNTRRLPANPIVAHEFSVNCPCSSCEERRVEILGSPTTRQQPNPFLDVLDSPLPISVSTDSPQHLPPASPTGSTRFPLSHQELLVGEVAHRRGEREASFGFASREPAFLILPSDAPVNSIPPPYCNASVRRNPSRRAKEEALVGIRKCTEKKSKFYCGFC